MCMRQLAQVDPQEAHPESSLGPQLCSATVNKTTFGVTTGRYGAQGLRLSPLSSYCCRTREIMEALVPLLS